MYAYLIKMKTYEELESYMDKELELKSRYLCLQQLYTFSVGKLGVYRRKTDGKEIPGLLKLLDEDEKATVSVHFSPRLPEK